MEALYTAEATATGDGRNGEVHSSDGVVDETLSVPESMGGAGGLHTNPEQLFASGYAACFHGALRLVARQSKATVEGSSVTAEVGIGHPDSAAEGFALQVTITAHLPGMEQGKADELAARAHQVCPYSQATKGNIDVAIRATT